MRQKTPLVLMELALMLGVFALCAALCMKGFAAADRISRESRLRDAAVTAAQNAAEVVKSVSGDLDAAAAILGGEAAGETLTVEGEGWTLTVTASSEGFLGRAQVAVCTPDGGTVAGLRVAWQEVAA